MQKRTFKNSHTTFMEYIKPDTSKTQNFTIVYAHGFCSDPFGRKPEVVKEWCIENGVGFVRFELAGHGSDKERFLDNVFPSAFKCISSGSAFKYGTSMVLAGQLGKDAIRDTI